MNDVFKCGDVVKLKSGGSHMTVHSRTPEGYRCIHHDREPAIYPEATLCLVPPFPRTVEFLF